jgi:alpha-N-acetylglucosamine transferase
VVGREMARSFEVKIQGIQQSPYTSKTIFLDSDTFVCEPIDQIFEFLDLFDMATTLDLYGHSHTFFQKYKPDYKLRLEGTLHEFNTGVIGLNHRDNVKAFMNQWLKTHRELNILADMPSFREAYFDSPVKIGILPPEYNFTGINSMTIAYTKVRVIHDRIGERWNNLRTHMATFEEMDKFSKRINKYSFKRLIIPYVGVIPYYFSPFYMKRKIKKILGVSMKKKRSTV